MVTEIGPNKADLYSKIFIQLVLVVILFYFIYHLSYAGLKHHSYGQRPKDFGYLAISAMFNVALFLRIYIMPYWLIIDDELKTLEIKYLMSKPSIINVHDIAVFSPTTIKTKSSVFFGIFVYLYNGKKILISDLNFENYLPVETFLNASHVEKSEDEKFSLFSLFFRHFKKKSKA
jgi:hypothetical protein